MRKIGVAISKGGTGKTTTAVNVAAGLAILGHRVLLIDTDTQGQAGAMLGLSPDVGLPELLLETVSFADAITQARENLFLLAGGRRIANAKRRIETEAFQLERYLTKKLTPHDKRFDFVIVDSGPGWDSLTINILFYVNEILAPVSMEALSVHSLAEFKGRVDDVQHSGANARLSYVLPTFLDGRVKKSDEIFQELRKHFAPVLCEPIHYNVKLSEAPANRETIFEYDKRSIGAYDYGQLIKRILGNAQA